MSTAFPCLGPLNPFSPALSFSLASSIALLLLSVCTAVVAVALLLFKWELTSCPGPCVKCLMCTLCVDASRKPTSRDLRQQPSPALAQTPPTPYNYLFMIVIIYLFKIYITCFSFTESKWVNPMTNTHWKTSSPWICQTPLKAILTGGYHYKNENLFCQSWIYSHQLHWVTEF